MILPPHRGHNRPRVVRRSTSIPSRMATSSIKLSRSAMPICDYEYSAEDRNRWYQQDQNTDVEVADKRTVVAQRRAAHNTLSKGRGGAEVKDKRQHENC